MYQLQQGRTGIVQQRRGEKGSSIGPILLAFSAWFISVPSAVFGLLCCLRWMVPKSPARLPIPEFLAYPFYIIFWTGSALVSDCHAVPSSRCGGHLAGPRVYLLAKDPPSGKGHYHRFAGPIHRGVLGDAVTDT
jgi:hypothetical protein